MDPINISDIVESHDKSEWLAQGQVLGDGRP